MIKFADLHTHTAVSDGTFTAENLIIEAKNRQLSAIAISDHDSVEAVSSAIEIGKKEGVEVISAIELTSDYEGTEIHILGYLVDHTDQIFLQSLEELRKDRIERVYSICAKLKGLGLNLNAEDVFAVATGKIISRLHIAIAMVKKGLVGFTQEAFRHYIGEGCPGYVPRLRLNPQGAIELIRKAKGIAVLAHPYIHARQEFGDLRARDRFEKSCGRTELELGGELL
mgnify:CR=1 FL=1